MSFIDLRWMLSFIDLPRMLGFVTVLLAWMALYAACARIFKDKVQCSRFWLRLVSWSVCYRFDYCLSESLEVPDEYKKVTTKEIQEKARGSISSVGIFFGLTVAIAAIAIGTTEGRNMLKEAPGFLTEPVMAWWLMLCILVPFAVIWGERFISAWNNLSKLHDPHLKQAARTWRFWCYQVPSLVSAIIMFVGIPLFGPWSASAEQQEHLQKVCALAGFTLLAASTFFLLIAVEFYDSASGWRGSNGLRFHLASIASSLYLVGAALAITGIALFICDANFVVGCSIALASLCGILVMTKSERALWDLKNPDDDDAKKRQEKPVEAPI